MEGNQLWQLPQWLVRWKKLCNGDGRERWLSDPETMDIVIHILSLFPTCHLVVGHRAIRAYVSNKITALFYKKSQKPQPDILSVGNIIKSNIECKWQTIQNPRFEASISHNAQNNFQIHFASLSSHLLICQIKIIILISHRYVVYENVCWASSISVPDKCQTFEIF